MWAQAIEPVSKNPPLVIMSIVTPDETQRQILRVWTERELALLRSTRHGFHGYETDGFRADYTIDAGW